MRKLFALTALIFVAATPPKAADEYRQLVTVNKLPVAPDPAFEFRKTKIFVLGDIPGRVPSGRGGGTGARDPSIGFEGAYRLYGAVTDLDKKQRYGHYFDFFWRAKRRANLTVRLEYQQEASRSQTQAREVSYANVKGNKKTSFAILGDDFFTDGHVLAWRCVLIENGRIVAEERSFLWH